MRKIKFQFFLFSFAILRVLPAEAQKFYNLDFEQKCDSSRTGLCYWELSWGGKNACIPEKSGKNQYLLITGKNEGAVGFAEQTSKLTNFKGLQIIKVSAKISSDSIKGKGAGLNVSIYDSLNNLLFTKDMGYASFNWVHGTSDWKEYTISAICPEEAAKIKIGAILYGKGKARFDDFNVVVTSVAGRKPSKLALGYISAACDTIFHNSLRKDSIDINKLKNTALQIAGDAKSYEDCHLAVIYLLESLGDHHSFFMTPKEVKSWQEDTTETANIEYAQCSIIRDCGYILVPPFHGGNKKLMIAYCDSIQEALKKLDNSNSKGWIIDLRKNTGGNMESMITGLGPLFDKEKLGGLVDVKGKTQSWYYKNGTYYWQDSAGMSASKPTILSPGRPIAVLIGPQTGSSGEIVVISFIGNGNTKIFGVPTWGLTTGNGSFDLPDGARMMLASTTMADRNGKLYYGSIQPDELVKQNKNSGDATIQEAINWILRNH